MHVLGSLSNECRIPQGRFTIESLVKKQSYHLFNPITFGKTLIICSKKSDNEKLR